MLLDEIKAKFEAAGHHVSQRDDVDESAVAWFLAMKPGTLRNWRGRGRAPVHYKLPSGIWYPLEGLLDFLAQKIVSRECTQMHATARLKETNLYVDSEVT